jgi:subtilisin family serine protease
LLLLFSLCARQPFEENGPNIMGMEFDLESGVLWNRPVADAFHGTHTVGTMMATGYNEEGLRGIIPRNEKFRLLVARVFGDGMIASAKISTIDKAIEWCADNGARIINLSLASASATVNSQLLYSQLVEEEGVLLVAASGNQGTMTDSYPAGYEHVVSVGSIDEDLTRSEFSQYGPSLDLVAPGRDVYSTVPSSGVLAENSETFEAGPMAFTPVHNYPVEGEIIDCGLGDVVCGNATGRVCLVEHSLGLPFQTLAENCEYGGGVSLVVYPGLGGESLDDAVMDLAYTGSISVVTVSRDNGLRLLAKRGTLASLSFTVPAYKTVTGTSMSAAHVSALAARLWAARPACTNSQIRESLEMTALDLGAEGRDDVYGHGLVQGAAAYDYLLSLPSPCGTASAEAFPHPLGNPDRPVTLRKTPVGQPDKQKICNNAMNPFCHRLEDQRRGRRGLRKGIHSKTS